MRAMLRGWCRRFYVFALPAAAQQRPAPTKLALTSPNWTADTWSERQVKTSDQAQQTGRDLDHRFTLIEQWPERVGSPEWRKRAVKELSPTEQEAFLFYAGTAEELSQEEREAICREWEVYNAARAKKFQRQEMMRNIIGTIDGAAGVISIFGAFGLFAWLISPAMFDDSSTALWLYFHLAVMGAWGISLLARLPNALRGMLDDRNRDRSAEEISRPIRYADDRIDAVAFEGRKYRSNAALTKAMQESHERARNVHAGQEVLKKGTGRAFILIMCVFEAVFYIGLFGLLEMDEGYVPLWLSIVLMILGGVGFFLVVRLRDRLLSRANYCSPALRWFDEAGRLKPIFSAPPSLPR